MKSLLLFCVLTTSLLPIPTKSVEQGISSPWEMIEKGHHKSKKYKHKKKSKKIRHRSHKKSPNKQIPIDTLGYFIWDRPKNEIVFLCSKMEYRLKKSLMMLEEIWYRVHPHDENLSKICNDIADEILKCRGYIGLEKEQYSNNKLYKKYIDDVVVKGMNNQELLKP